MASGSDPYYVPPITMITKQEFNAFFLRLSRSTPALGIVASLLSVPARLERKAGEDAWYRASIEEMGAKPKFPHDSVNMEKEIIAAEIVAHLVTLAVAVAAWRIYPDLLSVFLGAWVAAFVADWMGGRIAAWNFNRRHRFPVDDDDIGV